MQTGGNWSCWRAAAAIGLLSPSFAFWSHVNYALYVDRLKALPLVLLHRHRLRVRRRPGTLTRSTFGTSGLSTRFASPW